MKEKIIKKYLKENGKIPFDDWYYKLDKPLRNTIAIRLTRVLSNLYGKHRNLPNGIIELKFDNGLRLYFTEINNEILLLLLGGNKQRQSDDINKAQEYLKDYQERTKKHDRKK
ncbi:MAG TPA: hypothetical protein PLG15_04050 [Candidatus Gastranaerophilaceae bacterium]|nr:hypothetical protein [Candidatus Gastranaerophilaceae bacterium]HPT41538.1 hypothetical protein [Candidatus Gastranaerophilaceae bacterium]